MTTTELPPTAPPDDDSYTISIRGGGGKAYVFVDIDLARATREDRNVVQSFVDDALTGETGIAALQISGSTGPASSNGNGHTEDLFAGIEEALDQAVAAGFVEVVSDPEQAFPLDISSQVDEIVREAAANGIEITPPAPLEASPSAVDDSTKRAAASKPPSNKLVTAQIKAAQLKAKHPQGEWPTAPQVAAAAGVSKATAGTALRELKAKGTV